VGVSFNSPSTESAAIPTWLLWKIGQPFGGGGLREEGEDRRGEWHQGGVRARGFKTSGGSHKPNKSARKSTLSLLELFQQDEREKENPRGVKKTKGENEEGRTREKNVIGPIGLRAPSTSCFSDGCVFHTLIQWGGKELKKRGQAVGIVGHKHLMELGKTCYSHYRGIVPTVRNCERGTVHFLTLEMGSLDGKNRQFEKRVNC